MSPSTQSRLEKSVFETALALAVANQAQLKLFHCSTVPSATAMEFGDRYLPGGNIEQFLTIAQQQLDREMAESKQWLAGLEAQAKEAGIGRHLGLGHGGKPGPPNSSPRLRIGRQI